MKNDEVCRTPPLVAMTLLLLVSAMPSSAQVQIDFIPPTLNLPLGQSAYVAINVTGATAPGLAAFQFDLDFNPLAIQLLNPNEAFRGTILPFAPLGADPNCITVRGTPTCEDPIWFLDSTGRVPLGTDSIDNVTGHIEVAYGTTGVQAPPQGGGAIAFIEVFAEFNGTATITLSNVILADNQEPPMPMTLDPTGVLVVTSGTGIANQPPVLALIGDQQLFEGQTLSVPITSSDGDGDSLGLSTTGLPTFCNLLDNGNGTGSMDCAPAIGENGVFQVVVTTTDDGGPNLNDSETFNITVDFTTCNDGDGDGFGFPGDVSCPRGLPEDCNDAVGAINPDAVEICRSGIDEDCNGVDGAAEADCPSNTCIVITLGTTGSDPTILFGDPGNCPTALMLPRGVDVIWGALASLTEVGAQIDIGSVLQVSCGGFADTEQIDNLKPAVGDPIDFYLVRETGQPAYGTSSGAGLPRIPTAGDCP